MIPFISLRLFLLAYILVRKLVFNVKIVFCGEGGVGKSSILHRFFNNEFIENMSLTRGFGFYHRILNLGRFVTKITYWDLGGQEQFDEMTKNSQLLNRTLATVFVFDVSRISTIKGIHVWSKIIPLNRAPIKVLVGNKIDLISNISSTENILKPLAIDLGVQKYFLTSAATGFGIKALFEYIDEKIVSLIRSILSVYERKMPSKVIS